jgi:hypothetical protein
MSVEGNPVRNRLLRLELLLVIIVVGAGCFMGQTLRQEHTFDDIRSSQSRMLSNISRMLSKNEREVKSVATSVSALTTALALSNSQIADLASELELRKHRMKLFGTRLQAMESVVRSKPLPIPLPPILPVAPVSGTRPHSTAEGPSSTSPHIHSMDLSIPIPAGFVLHRNSQGQVDCWIGTRVGPSGGLSVRVQPYRASVVGVLVHSIDEGKDYVLTEQGGWTEIPENRDIEPK